MPNLNKSCFISGLNDLTLKNVMHGVGLQNTLNGLEKFFFTTFLIGYDSASKRLIEVWRKEYNCNL
jgi:hypothetical protein